MRIISTLSLFLLGLALATLLGSFVVPAKYRSQSQLVQLAKPNDADTVALTGEAWTPIGEPQVMVIQDQKAFLTGKTDSGAAVVSDEYLKAHNEYPLQMKTVDFVSGLVRLGAVGAAALFGLIAWWTRKKSSIG